MFWNGLSRLYLQFAESSFQAVLISDTGGIDMQDLNYSAVGERIRQARKEKGWSQGQLARKCSISTSFMGHIERGTRIMSLDTFVKICDVLEADADELLWGVPHPSDTLLLNLWTQTKKDGTDGYSMYVRIMKSVAEIINEGQA